MMAMRTLRSLESGQRRAQLMLETRYCSGISRNRLQDGWACWLSSAALRHGAVWCRSHLRFPPPRSCETLAKPPSLRRVVHRCIVTDDTSSRTHKLRLLDALLISYTLHHTVHQPYVLLYPRLYPSANRLFAQDTLRCSNHMLSFL